MKQDCGCPPEPKDCHPSPGKEGVEVFLDGEKFFSKLKTLTANALLKLAGLDPIKNYLVKIYKGRPGDSFEGKGESEVHLENCDKFIAVSLGPTPVS